MKNATKKHLENLKNHEYAKKHRQKMIMKTIKHLFGLENNVIDSGDVNLHKRNIEIEKNNLIMTINTEPQKVTWY